MRCQKTSIFAFAVLCCAAGANAAIIKAAGKAGTTTKTTTTGQKTILMNIDPYNVSSFQLDVMFEADKVQFVGVIGQSGYIVPGGFQVTTEGSFGYINNIFGFWPGFGPSTIPLNPDGPIGDLPAPPPPGAQNIFQVEFIDLRPDLDKRFDTLAGDDDDFIEGFDPQTGLFTRASGVDIDSSFDIVRGDPNGGSGGNAAPLPGALVMGLLGGAGVLGNVARKRRQAA